MASIDEYISDSETEKIWFQSRVWCVNLQNNMI